MSSTFRSCFPRQPGARGIALSLGKTQFSKRMGHDHKLPVPHRGARKRGAHVAGASKRVSYFQGEFASLIATTLLARTASGLTP